MQVESCYEDDEFCDERRTQDEHLGELKCVSTYTFGLVSSDLTTSGGISHVNVVLPFKEKEV